MNRFSDIRVFDGTQARAWEELSYQLRPAPGPGHAETRKTKAPDGGVEWYEIYADGHEEGFQAKFNPSLEDALSGMRESVKTVAERRLSMTHLTFLVPYDFSDTPGPRKSDQDRWDDAVASWKKDIPGASNISFAVRRGGDVLQDLTREEHAGRRMFWFGELELSDAWFSKRWSETKAVVGQQYTPNAHTRSRIEEDIAATVLSPAFAESVKDQGTRVIAKCEQDYGAWGGHADAARATVSDLKRWLDASFGRPVDANGYADLSRPATLDFGQAETCARVLVGKTEARRQEMDDAYDRNPIDTVQQAVAAFLQTVTGRAAALCSAGALAISGPAGQGKTHTLVHAARELLDAGAPAIVLPGSRFGKGAWWTEMAGALGGLGVTSDEFFTALDSLAQARGRRAVVIIDALNESESPGRWKTELTALHAQVSRYPWVTLVVSYRQDYQQIISPPAQVRTVNHPGLAGAEADALRRYCDLFKIPVPTASMFDAAFSNPLFLRMYCEVRAADTAPDSSAITRSNLFNHFTATRGRRVLDILEVSPASQVVDQAMALMADALVASGGRRIPREQVESALNHLLTERTTWPRTLFGALMSEGLIEVAPSGAGGAEVVGLPFQAYSEHVVVNRLFDAIENKHAATPERSGFLWRRRRQELMVTIAVELAHQPRFWRAAAVLIPERYGHELTDMLPAAARNYRLLEVTRESLIERQPDAFTARAFEILQDLLAGDERGSAVDVMLALAPRLNHPANGRWLHDRLRAQAMPDRDATWGIASYNVDEESPALQRIIHWSAGGDIHASDNEIILAAIPLMWLLTSPNRFLRDQVTKVLVQVFRRRLTALAELIGLARETGDVYVQERVITAAYGAVMIGGDADRPGVEHVADTLEDWRQHGLPVNVLARDSARGVIAWAHDRGIIDSSTLSQFAPPYGAEPPAEPPTRGELEDSYGWIPGPDPSVTEWRAQAILSSCLDWMGDFNKYVIASDVDYFSQYPLSGPPPSAGDMQDPFGEVNAEWAGRWVANRAINLGWTPERFSDFERNLTRGREAHKAERFGKKYQWIAHHELMARLADNFHPAPQPWQNSVVPYEGPWPWFGRDIDPSLPPSSMRAGLRVCPVNYPAAESWLVLPQPDLDTQVEGSLWIPRSDDLPEAFTLLRPTDPTGTGWIALHRHSSWHRDNSSRSWLHQRERDLFLLQFSWLAPKGSGQAVYDYLVQHRLKGRWMNEARKEYRQYLGEDGWAPIAATPRDPDVPSRLQELGLETRPATEEYLWEGNTLDCSIDETLNFHTPTPELAGPARWSGDQAAWVDGGQVICRAITVADPAGRDHDALIADRQWLEQRLLDLGMELVIGTLGEKKAASGNDDRAMSWSDITYAGLVVPGQPLQETGPLVNIQRIV